MSSLSLTGKRWIFSPAEAGTDAVLNDPATLVAFLLEARGINAAQVGEQSWNDPNIYADVGRAVERVRTAVDRTERIGIFGDYDCDGVTATALVLRALRRRGVEPIVRLPHRVRDGYGLKESHVDELHAEGVKLLITVDTGISAHAAMERAAALGIDVLILDHHHVVTAPRAYAILHPLLVPNFPQPCPAAAGVALAFVHALESEEWEDRDTDLVIAAIGTVADLVPLKGINRRLVQEGLRAATRLGSGPLKDFIDAAMEKKVLKSTDIAFRLAPRINAAGRMSDPILALNALLEGGALLSDLEDLNRTRQDETERAVKKALAGILENPAAAGSFLSIAGTEYPHGILGLIAGKLTEKFGRPSMAVNIEGELCTASLRGPLSYNIAEALHRHAHLLVSYGGHAQAGGATFALEQYMALADALERDALERIPADSLAPTIALDATLSPVSLTRDFVNALAELEPFGQGNPEPLFLIKGAVLDRTRRVGTEGRHLQAKLGNIGMIGFGLGHLSEQLSGEVDLACRITENEWNGRRDVQLSVVDIRAAQPLKEPVPKAGSAKKLRV